MTAVSHLNAVKPFRQCTPCLWSQHLCHVCPGDWHQCLTYTHIPARPVSPNIFSLFYNEVPYNSLFWWEQSHSEKEKSGFFTLLLPAWKACSDFGFPCKKSKSKPGYYFLNTLPWNCNYHIRNLLFFPNPWKSTGSSKGWQKGWLLSIRKTHPVLKQTLAIDPCPQSF